MYIRRLHFLPRRPCQMQDGPAARDRSLSTGSPYHGHPTTYVVLWGRLIKILSLVWRRRAITTLSGGLELV
jgi:hypothetical protein